MSLKKFHLLVCLLLFSGTVRVAADDWPGWRGPSRDAICRETGLLKRWPPGGPKLAWVLTGLGEGYSGPAVVSNVLYTMGNKDGRERVMAIDVSRRGRIIWDVDFGPVEYEGYAPGTRSTPTIDGDSLYALGASGKLACLSTKNGDIRWARNYVSDFGGTVLKWAYSESVLIDGDRLICTPGGTKATFAALDKSTGNTVWLSSIGDAANYASIVKASIAGVPQYIQFLRAGVVGVRASDGKLLWRYDAPAHTEYGGINVSTPIWSGQTVFAAAGYGVGGGLAAIEKTAEGFGAKEVYFTKDMKNHHGGMILLDGALYGCNDPGILTCLDYMTGKVLWQSRRPGKCSLLYADGMLYCRSEKGPISLVEATADGFHINGSFEQPRRSDKQSWPHLVIANGRMYVRDQDVLLCYDLRQQQQ